MRDSVGLTVSLLAGRSSTWERLRIPCGSYDAGSVRVEFGGRGLCQARCCPPRFTGRRTAADIYRNVHAKDRLTSGVLLVSRCAESEEDK